MGVATARARSTVRAQTSVAVLVPNIYGQHLGTGTDHFTLAAQLQESVAAATPAG